MWQPVYRHHIFYLTYTLEKYVTYIVMRKHNSFSIAGRARLYAQAQTQHYIQGNKMSWQKAAKTWLLFVNKM